MDSETGGSGKPHDWSISEIVSEYAKTKGLAFVLAGGINASNIQEAYKQVKPDMIDIMSEARLKDCFAKKDHAKIVQIMNIVNKINRHEI